MRLLMKVCMLQRVNMKSSSACSLAGVALTRFWFTSSERENAYAP